MLVLNRAKTVYKYQLSWEQDVGRIRKDMVMVGIVFICLFYILSCSLFFL